MTSRFKPQFSRLLSIDREIRKGGYPNCNSLAKGWEVSYKTIRRDLDYLRWELGAPLQYDRLRHGFYYDDPTWFLPSLMLSEGDILAILIGTRALAMYQGAPVGDDLKSIYGRLAASLPKEAAWTLESIKQQFSFVGPAVLSIREDIWKTVVAGLMQRRVLEVHYTAAGAKAPKAHRLHPYHLANVEGEWYLLAKDERWEEPGQYALGRMQTAALTDETFNPPAQFDPESVLVGRYGRFLPMRAAGSGAHRVRLRFTPKLAPYIAERTWYPGQTLRRRRDGGLDLAFPSQRLTPLLPWILSFGPQVQALAPARLVKLMKHTIESMHRQIRA